MAVLMSRGFRENEYLQNLVRLNADTSDCVIPLYDTAIAVRAERILELGVRQGVSTRALLLAAQFLGAHLWSVDVDPCLEASRAIDGWGLTQHWSFIRAESREFLRSWRPGPMDLVFIDSGHSYELTLDELRLTSRLLWPWGVILLHDTQDPNWPGVAQAVRQFLALDPERYSYQELGTRHGLGKISVKGGSR